MIAVWELSYKIGVEALGIWKPYSFPSPESVLQTLLALMGDNTLWIAIFTSVRRIITGYCISVVIGVAMGLFMERFRIIGKHLSPLLLGLQTLPNVCWIPFAVLWYGLGESSILFVVVMGSAFAITLTVESGIRNVNPLLIKAAKTMGITGRKAYWHVAVPAALPTIMSGMKQGWSFAWRALMAGEMFTATVGLGQVLTIGRELADISQVVAVMIVIILLGLLADKIVFHKIESGIRVRWGLDKN